MPGSPTLSDGEYERLLAVRVRLREFERWSADRAASHGLTASQHQLLLAIRGHGPVPPTIGDVAHYLFIRHNTAVELVDRTERRGLLERSRDAADHRVARLSLTPDGHDALASLSAAHLEELAGLAPMFEELLLSLRATGSRHR